MVDSERQDRRGLRTVPQSCKVQWERNLRGRIESKNRPRRRITKTRRHSRFVRVSANGQEDPDIMVLLVSNVSFILLSHRDQTFIFIYKMNPYHNEFQRVAGNDP